MARSKEPISPKGFALAFRTLFPPEAGRELPRALVACSGGVDSMVLLDLLRGFYQRRGKLAALHVCHCDHGQRTYKDAARDEMVVREYCRHHGIALTVEKLSLKPGASEAEMRTARYMTLARLAAKQRAIVFTAHHADDQLETLLLRVLRGTHPTALRGIAPRARRAVGPHTLRSARPLLVFTKKDLIRTARARELAWSEDESNQSARYTRNRVRHELIPLLESLRPGAGKRMAQFFEATVAEHAAAAKTEMVSHETASQIANHLRGTDGYPVEAATFPALQSAVHLLLHEHSARTTGAHWESVKRQLSHRLATRRGGGPAKTLQFPGGHALAFRGNRLFWVKIP